MNLATARSAERTKEVGMRKVAGAYRSQLISQFLGESIVVSLVALFLAIGISELFLPIFKNVSGKELSFN